LTSSGGPADNGLIKQLRSVPVEAVFSLTDKSREEGGIMSKKALVVLTLAVAVVFLMSSAGCVSKKRLRTVEEQNAQQLAQANGRINDLQQKSDALDKSLKDAQSALAGAESQNKKLAADAASFRDQIAALEGQKAELDKAVAAGKETEESLTKKMRGLNGAIATLKKKAAELEATIAAKDGEISSLQQNVTSLKSAADEQTKAMAALNADKNTLSATLDKTISSKKSTTLILSILLGLAVILAIVGFVRKKAAAV
jgi:septal ring factor EnvC (AmiA/AmiB activator)